MTPALAEGDEVGSEEGGTLLAAGWEELGPLLRGAGIGFTLESKEGMGDSLGWEGAGGYRGEGSGG